MRLSTLGSELGTWRLFYMKECLKDIKDYQSGGSSPTGSDSNGYFRGLRDTIFLTMNTIKCDTGSEQVNKIGGHNASLLKREGAFGYGVMASIL